MTSIEVGPTWSEAIRVIARPPFLRKTIQTAPLASLALFFINRLDEVLEGKAMAVTWIKGAGTCLVPFGVANWGVLAGTRRRSR
jgi:hypothetical protein